MAVQGNERVEWLTEEEVSPYIRRAQAFGCDSSDEEDEQDYPNQTITEELETDENFKEIFWSYVALAIATKLLHSRKVNEAYEEKTRNLQRRFAVPSLESLNEGIRLAAQHVHTFQRQFDVNSVATNILQKIRNNFQGFFKSLWSREAMQTFFQSLTDGGLGYWKDNLLGWYHKNEELGELRIAFSQETVINFQEYSINFSVGDGWVDFFSSLRLYNSMAKDVAKYGSLRFGNYTKKCLYKYNDEQKECSIRCWFGLNRQDFVLGLNIYPSFTHEFSKEELDVLPSVVNPEGHLVSEKAIMLHFLLFGVEAMRSPSALIHHMMFLDLVKTGKRSWDEDFVGRKLPMSIEGAVNASRMKHDILNRKLKRKYTYDYVSANVNKDTEEILEKQLKLEKEITQDWLKMKLGDEQSSDTTTKIKLIQDACIEWYGIDVEE